MSPVPTNEPTPENREAGWNRLLQVGLLFLIYEAILVGPLQSLFFTGEVSVLVVWIMVGAAALGYFLLGALSRTWVSGVFLVIPLLIVLGLGQDMPQDVRGGENVPLYVAWFFLSIIFVPVWMIGVLATWSRPERDNDSLED